jgi:hypothetical protein
MSRIGVLMVLFSVAGCGACQLAIGYQAAQDCAQFLTGVAIEGDPVVIL